MAQNLSQVQAVRIVSTLADGGIAAKVVRERGSYRVLLADGATYGAATQILSKQELLKDEGPSLTELLSQQGLMPTSREIESLRVDYALSLSLQEALEALPAVTMARVIVRSSFRGDPKSVAQSAGPGVSVMLRTRAGLTKVDPARIVEIIRRAVPGVSADAIALEIQVDSDSSQSARSDLVRTPAADLVSFLIFWRVPAAEYRGIALAMFGGIVLALAVGIGIGVLVWRRRSRGETAPSSYLPVVASSAGGGRGGFRSVAIHVDHKRGER